MKKNEDEKVVITANSIEELKDILRKNRGETKKIDTSNIDNKILDLKKNFLKWKKSIEKVMKDNKVDRLVAEQEFYSHINELYNWVNSGKKFEDAFGNEDEFFESDDLVITYDIIDDLKEAINNCWYYIKKFNNDNIYNNDCIIVILSNYEEGSDYTKLEISNFVEK